MLVSYRRENTFVIVLENTFVVVLVHVEVVLPHATAIIIDYSRLLFVYSVFVAHEVGIPLNGSCSCTVWPLVSLLPLYEGSPGSVSEVGEDD